MNYVTFDIETYSPSGSDKINTSELQASVVGAYFSWLDSYIAFMEDEIVDFLNILKEVDLVIGFNQIWFDLPILQKYSNYPLLNLNNYDILLEFEKKVGYKAKLNDLCKANFTNDLKTDTYENFKNYHMEEQWGKLIDYCLNDVRLTQQLFAKILAKTPINYMDLHIKYEALLSDPTHFQNFTTKSLTPNTQAMETVSIF